MSAEIIDTNQNKVTIKITGLLNNTDLIGLQQSIVNYMEQYGGIKLLILSEEFEGWGKQGDWGDLSFQDQYDGYIQKMAIVGEQKWEEAALIFTGKGLRDFPIEYFQPEQLADAQAWLMAD